MINDNVLADRLNAFRAGKEPPEPTTDEQTDQLNPINDRISIFNIKFT